MGINQDIVWHTITADDMSDLNCPRSFPLNRMHEEDYIYVNRNLVS